MKDGKNADAWRVFCAIDTPTEVSGLIVQHVKNLQTEFPHVPASWSREGNFHLTLKFLGDIDRERVAEVSRAASLAVDGIEPFLIVIGGAGTFPKHGPPRVLWIGVDDPAGRLATLKAQVEAECTRLRFPSEERHFHPHLTIARLRIRQGAKELGLAHRDLGFEPLEMTVSELVVIRSQLSPKGSKYSEISTHLLHL